MCVPLLRSRERRWEKPGGAMPLGGELREGMEDGAQRSQAARYWHSLGNPVSWQMYALGLPLRFGEGPDP